MTVRYVDSAATRSNNGTSWANAYTTLAGAATNDTAGDVIYVKSTHSESTAGAVTYDWAGTTADPTRVICVSDSNEPPTTVATGAVVAVTGANNLTLASANDVVYFYGIRFKAGDSTNGADIIFAARSSFESCNFELGGNNSGSDFNVTSVSTLGFKSCSFKSVNAGSQIFIYGVSQFEFCSIESGGTPGSPLFTFQSSESIIRAQGFDFSNLSASAHLFSELTGNAGPTLSIAKCRHRGRVRSTVRLQRTGLYTH